MKVTPHLVLCSCRRHARIAYGDEQRSELFYFREQGTEALKALVQSGHVATQEASIVQQQIDKALPSGKEIADAIMKALAAVREIEKEFGPALEHLRNGKFEEFEGCVMN
jgi:hypothetical protein